MTQPIESATVAAVSLALDAATLRHQAIATNISNASTPGYRPLRVSFDAEMRALAVEPEPGAAPRVALDKEVAHLSENSIHYQALLRALNRHYAILASAINEGRR